MISLIAAMSKNRVIGSNNQLPWHLPEDLKYFREKTKNKIIIMGRKTFDSIGKALPHRCNIVITRNPNFAAPHTFVAPSLERALEIAKKHIPEYDEEIFIVGGEQIYKLALPYAHRIYLTEIDIAAKGDSYFPEFNRELFKEISRKPQINENTTYAFVIYERQVIH